MDRQKDTGFEAILEYLIEHGANGLAIQSTTAVACGPRT